MSSSPQLTVFTASVYEDVARVWHACTRRAFPAEDVQLEIFCDTEKEFDAELFPGVRLIKRSPSRRDFHEAYNDAVRRAPTPYLAITDSDVYWISKKLWPRLREELKDPDLAAVSCISRTHRPSHGTFAVILKPDVYRQVLETLPEGFFPAAEVMDLERPMDEWSWYDSGDRISQAVLGAGKRIRFLNLDQDGELFRLQSVTLVRRTSQYLDQSSLVAMAAKSRHFWRGYASNLVLKRLHRHLFPDGPSYRFPFSGRPLAELLRQGRREDRIWRRAMLREMLQGASRVRDFAHKCRDALAGL